MMLVLLMLVLMELVVDEGSRSGIVLCRSATGVEPSIAVTGAVVVLSLTQQREGADDENLNK